MIQPSGGIVCSTIQMILVGETVARQRLQRRRSTRLGNSQAKGPQGDETLESRGISVLLTDGVNRPRLAWPLRRLSQVVRTEGATAFFIWQFVCPFVPWRQLEFVNGRR